MRRCSAATPGAILLCRGAISQIAEGVYRTGVQFTLEGTSLGPAPSPTVSLAPVQAPARECLGPSGASLLRSTSAAPR